MSGAEFERAYAKRSGVTVERLRELGRVVATCDCGEPECEGFQSISRELLDSYRSMGRQWVEVRAAASGGDA